MPVSKIDLFEFFKTEISGKSFDYGIQFTTTFLSALVLTLVKKDILTDDDVAVIIKILRE
ncbi:MAG TPA: hypothetical protein VMX17_05765 [Candidatus Glassbacteria bacterium]|nr:hypothetical protein [Candidatus Glassbacteria bacterium]